MKLPRKPAHGMAWALLLPLAGWFIVAFVGFVVRCRWPGAYRLIDMVVAQAVVVAVVYATLIPVLGRVARSQAERRFRIALTAGAVRFIVTLLLLTLVVWFGGVRVQGFLVWAAVTYVVMVTVETFILCRWMGRCELK